MQLVTMTPIRSHLNLRQGVNERSAEYSQFLSQLDGVLQKQLVKQLDESGDLSNRIAVQHQNQGKAYTNTGSDDRDTLCLFTHTKEITDQLSLEAKVYSNTLSVVTVTMDMDYVIATLEDIAQSLSVESSLPSAVSNYQDRIAALCGLIQEAPHQPGEHVLLPEIYQLLDEDTELTLELFAQAQSTYLISKYYRDELYPALRDLPKTIQVSYLEALGDFSGFNDIKETDGSNVDQPWSSRLLRLDRSEREGNESLIENWLAETPHPEHAKEILEQNRMDSLVWLNYVLVDEIDEKNKPLRHKSDYKLEAMGLAQYFYAVQHACNSNLYMAISDTYLESNTHVAEDILAGVRATTRMHISDYHENCQYLTRDKKLLLENILAGWDYEQMVQNSERLIEVCSSKIKDIHATRSEKSSFYTDLILVAIGFISLFDLAITISEYSRTYTSNAALGYRDEQPSSFLSGVANMETDLLLLSSVVSIILLFVVYYVAKRR
ncbi:hypothetical protein ACMXYR_06840 [Neptuniibacter sp. QD29_5]|uniref:hypothetical protein n=1 Tax=unclassified Neptuniibacter TaxID=2630693 RepID=UPI0039F6A4BD